MKKIIRKLLNYETDLIAVKARLTINFFNQTFEVVSIGLILYWILDNLHDKHLGPNSPKSERWTNGIRKMIGTHWQQVAIDRSKWKDGRPTYPSVDRNRLKAALLGQSSPELPCSMFYHRLISNQSIYDYHL